MRLVTVDIDGTLTLVHGWRIIAERFGRQAQNAASADRFRRGEIGEDTRLYDLLCLAQGHTVGEVEAALAQTPVLAHILEGVEAIRADGRRVALLSHNPPYVCRWYMERFGFDGWEGSWITPPGPDGRIPAPGLVRADKIAGLENLLRRYGTAASEAVHVGDGPSDAEVFRRVGAGIAVNSIVPDVERAATRVVHTRDFDDIVRAVRSIAASG